MKHFLSLIALIATSPAVLAITPEKRNGAPAAVHLPIQRRDLTHPLPRRRSRTSKDRSELRQGEDEDEEDGSTSDDDDDTVSQVLDNDISLYYANVSVGTPPQILRMHIDTGSSDLWINSQNSQLCRNFLNPCDQSGTYDESESSTYEFVNDEFYIQYADGSEADGDYVTDVFRIGDVEIDELQFGVGYLSTSPNGIMGIGYSLNEIQVVLNQENPYPNIPIRLLEEGHINSLSYSIWLNDLDASTGSILFGGTDTEKYEGQLSTLPVLSEDNIVAEFIIALTGIGINGEENVLYDGGDDDFIPVLLDTGASLTYLPNDIVEALYDRYDVDPTNPLEPLVDCDLANSDDTIDFTFTGPTISVPMNEMILNLGLPFFGSGEVCFFGILPTNEVSPVLGDTFLRSAYVVYHLGNNEISIAPTIFNATGSNIREINNGTDGVPDATIVAGAASTGAGLGGGARADDTPGFNSDFEDELESELESDNSNDGSNDDDDAVETVELNPSEDDDDNDDDEATNETIDDDDTIILNDSADSTPKIKIMSVLVDALTTGTMVVVVVHAGMAWLS